MVSQQGSGETRSGSGYDQAIVDGVAGHRVSQHEVTHCRDDGLALDKHEVRPLHTGFPKMAERRIRGQHRISYA